MQYEARLQRLLHRFLDPSFEVRADSYLNILLRHLSGNDDKGWYAPCYPLFTEVVELLKLFSFERGIMKHSLNDLWNLFNGNFIKTLL